MRAILYCLTLLCALLQPNYAMEKGVGGPFSSHYPAPGHPFFTEHGKNQEFLFEDVAAEITDDDDDQDTKRKGLTQENNPISSHFKDLTFFKEANLTASHCSNKSLRFHSRLYLQFQVFRI